MAGIKGKSGRQPELTKALAEAIVKGVRAGLPESRAAMAANYSPAAVSKWKSRGVNDLDAGRTTVFSKFVNDLIAADTAFEQVRLANILAASRNPRTWQASAWLLERKFSHWRKRLAIGGDENAPPVHTEDRTPDAILARGRKLAKMLQDAGHPV